MPYKTKEEIAGYLSPYANNYGIWGDQSFAGSLYSANQQRRALDQLYAGQPHDEHYDLFNSSLKGQQGSAIAGGITAGLQGATTLISGAQQAAHINDTSAYEGQIDDLARAGNYDYNNFAQLSNDYAQTNFNPNIDYSQIRGMSDWEKAGNIGTSALTGAATGFQIGGPWGALAGGIVGLGSGIAGVVAGNRNAASKEMYLKSMAENAQDTAQANFGAAHERIRERQDRQNAINVAEKGGQIERKQMSMKEFADRVLTKKGTPANKIVRTKGEGGTIIRIRVK